VIELFFAVLEPFFSVIEQFLAVIVVSCTNVIKTKYHHYSRKAGENTLKPGVLNYEVIKFAEH